MTMAVLDLVKGAPQLRKQFRLALEQTVFYTKCLEACSEGLREQVITPTKTTSKLIFIDLHLFVPSSS